jgi:hypothetical protein
LKSKNHVLKVTVSNLKMAGNAGSSGEHSTGVVNPNLCRHAESIFAKNWPAVFLKEGMET